MDPNVTYSAPEDADLPSMSVQDWLLFVYNGIIFVFGILGNIACLIKYAPCWKSSSSCTHYVAAISAADLCTLFILAVNWIERHFEIELSKTSLPCKMVTFLGFTGSFLCPWFIAELTLERFLVVQFPLTRRRLINPARTAALIAVTTFVGILYNMWTLAGVDSFLVPVYHNKTVAVCSIKRTFANFALTFEILNVVFAFTLPMALLAILNAWIAAIMVRRLQLRNRQPVRLRLASALVSGSDSSSCANSLSICANTDHLSRTQSRRQTRTATAAARKLLIVSALYFTLNLPTYVVRLHQYVVQRVVSGPWISFFYVMFTTQFSLNNLIYSTIIPDTLKLRYSKIAMALTGGRHQPRPSAIPSPSRATPPSHRSQFTTTDDKNGGPHPHFSLTPLPGSPSDSPPLLKTSATQRLMPPGHDAYR